MDSLNDTIDSDEEGKPREIFAKQNQGGETTLYFVAEFGHVDMYREIIQYYDLTDVWIKPRNGFGALHIAAKQGDISRYAFYI